MAKINSEHLFTNSVQQITCHNSKLLKCYLFLCGFGLGKSMTDHEKSRENERQIFFIDKVLQYHVIRLNLSTKFFAWNVKRC